MSSIVPGRVSTKKIAITVVNKNTNYFLDLDQARSTVAGLLLQ